MNGCPFHQNKLRADLPPLTERIAALPIDERGFPIPFFVAYIDGKPDFRLSDPAKWIKCHNEKLCWTCGQKLGRFVTFVIGPMCCLNRTTSEPPSHLECAQWSVRGCPFLSRPNMVRREDEVTQSSENNVPGEMIKRNPGVTAIWTAKGYAIFRDQKGRPLIEIGKPVNPLEWWTQGRHATRREVMASIESGLPLLKAACLKEETLAAQTEAVMLLEHALEDAFKLIPQEDIILPGGI